MGLLGAAGAAERWSRGGTTRPWGRQIGGQCGPGSVRQQRGGSEGLEGSRMDLEFLKLMCGEQREPAAGRLVRTGWLRRLKARNDTA